MDKEIFIGTYYIYFLWSENTIVYIGLSGSLKERILWHRRSGKKFDKHTFFSTEKSIGKLQERDLIEMFKPKYNRDYVNGHIYTKKFEDN